MYTGVWECRDGTHTNFSGAQVYPTPDERSGVDYPPPPPLTQTQTEQFLRLKLYALFATHPGPPCHYGNIDVKVLGVWTLFIY